MPPKRKAQASFWDWFSLPFKKAKPTEEPAEEKPAEEKQIPHGDLICPITLELPWDPVTAEDGHVYQRSAIETYFESKVESEVKSPVGKAEKMGKRLFPATQHGNLIETLIENGRITGEQAEKWKEMRNITPEGHSILKKAAGGDANAMYTLCCAYDSGKYGFKKDMKMFYHWLEKAFEAGDVRAAGGLAEALLKGLGTDKNVAQGWFYAGFAVEHGSSIAHGLYGLALADGRWGMHVDKARAIRFLKLVVDGSLPYNHTSKAAMQDIKERLERLEQDAAAEQNAAEQNLA